MHFPHQKIPIDTQIVAELHSTDELNMLNSWMQRLREHDGRLFLSLVSARIPTPLEIEHAAPAALVSGAEATKTPESVAQAQRSIEASPAPLQIIDLDDDKVLSLKKSDLITEILEVAKPVYAIVFEKVAQLVSCHQTKRKVCDGLKAASLEISRSRRQTSAGSRNDLRDPGRAC